MGEEVASPEGDFLCRANGHSLPSTLFIGFGAGLASVRATCFVGSRCRGGSVASRLIGGGWLSCWDAAANAGSFDPNGGWLRKRPASVRPMTTTKEAEAHITRKRRNIAGCLGRHLVR